MCFVSLFLVCLLSITMFVGESTAQYYFEEEVEACSAASGLFIGLGMSRSSIGGDFDGESYIEGGGSIEILPDLESAHGPCFSVGYHLVEKDCFALEAEIGYQQSNHDGSFSLIPVPVEFGSFHLDVRFGLVAGYLWGIGIQPYALGGLSLSHVTIEDGSFDDNEFKDATFRRGGGLRWGGGIAFLLGTRVSLLLQIVDDNRGYGDVQGVVSGEIDGKIHGEGLNLVSQFRLNL